MTSSPTLDASGGREALAAYARGALRGEPIYRGYRPRTALLQRAADSLPTAHVVVVSGAWCGDCRREVPKLARIMESLPAGWTVETLGEEARERLGVRAIPTVVVLDRAGGRELGRIIESPEGPDGLEGDLLAIAEQARALHGSRAA